ncbi:hypothetical protein [Nannocystis sp. SCPEA4]|uniref:hypothetical protein n=1 Tax=Nannocystis sp. SCPEA4 TaxID=2996787 RepID=UPI00226E0A55|nr:hypothetical protein [Nannocystis sp. SCPEA4]MCY1060169.1 hypothetical protein [Nannocystis sp. SCPEA4]
MPRSRSLRTTLALALVSGAAACVDDTTTPLGERVLRIPEDFELCLVSPSPLTFQGAPLFHYRGLLRLGAGDVVLPSGPHVEAEAWIAYSLQSTADGPEVAGGKSLGAVSLEPDLALDRAPGAPQGWELAAYTDDPTAKPWGERLHLRVAYPTDTTEFDLSPLLLLDREGRLRVLASVPGVAADDPPLRVRAAPCERDDLDVDRVDVTLAEGAISFHTRPAIARHELGFTVLVEGEVDGIAIDVDSYWDLEYSAGNVGGAYGFQPVMAVRFAEQADGACILVVRSDPYAAETTWLAELLDCAQNHLRDLSVESVDIAQGGGEPRW